MTELSSWCRVGARVVCVRGGFRTWNGETNPVVNQVYSIRDFKYYSDSDMVGLWFYEISNPVKKYLQGHEEVSFDARCFRPVRDTSIEALRALLHPTPDEVRRLELEDA